MASSQIAFVPDTRVASARLGEGALSGLTFAAKDVFAIRGHVSSAGHPSWASTHPPAEHNASVVSQLLEAGADLIGVTILDELAYSLTGENPHYGTPHNPRAEGRLCGGSSCGSAAAVAGSLCDFAIGTDTAGSIRVPAAFCGVYGMRPTHGILSTAGVVPLAPSFDTVGWLARDAHTFDTVASVLLPSASPRPIERVLIAEDALARCDAGVPELLGDLLGRALSALGVAGQPMQVAEEGFDTLREALRKLQACEVWRTHGAWIERAKPTFSPGVAARFELARELSWQEDTLTRERSVRAELRARLARWLTPGTLLFLPPAPGIAPKLGTGGEQLETFRARTLDLTCIASLAGVPQLVVPAHGISGPPLALSFVAAPGSDGWLAQLAAPLDRALGG